MINKILLQCFVVGVFISGCASKPPYTFNGKSYYEYEQVVSAVDVYNREKIDSVKPRSKPIYPMAKIIILSQEELQKRDSGASKIWSYSIYRKHKSTAEMLRKRNIFTEVSIEEGLGYPMPPVNEYPQIFLYSPKGKSEYWRYIAKDGTVSPLFLDGSAESKFGEYDYLIHTIEALASAEAN